MTEVVTTVAVIGLMVRMSGHPEFLVVDPVCRHVQAAERSLDRFDGLRAGADEILQGTPGPG